MARYDLAIVGGGPGGASAAKTAAELGLKTVFLERAGRAGEKNASGCGLGQRWWKDFPEVMESVVRLPSYREIDTCIFKITDEADHLVATLSTGKTRRDRERFFCEGVPRGMSGTSVYRSDLDPLLAELACKAGAELRTSTLVTDVLSRDGKVKGVLTGRGEKIEADVVIGADGAHSTVAIRSGIRKRFRRDEITLVPQVDFSCSESRLDDVIGAANLVWFGPYCGAYQVNFRDGFHLGLGQWLDAWDTRPQDMVKRILKIPAFQAMCRAVDAQLREFQIHLLPWMPHPPRTHGEGVMLVGDAGGFPCPLEAEGIWHACMSGRIAARVAAEAIAKGEPSAAALAEYERRWKESSLSREYRFGREFVSFWRNSAFHPELMKKIVLFLGELQSLTFPGPVFDWSDDHMTTFNEHLEHLLDVLPELSGFARQNLVPLGRGISARNRERIADMLAGAIRSRLRGIVPRRLIRAVLRKALGLPGSEGATAA
ncbi:MAG: NAD(P)/FAD-dependent oxidoreductase [bacterium]